jgi:hypothetical protein
LVKMHFVFCRQDYSPFSITVFIVPPASKDQAWHENLVIMPQSISAEAIERDWHSCLLLTSGSAVDQERPTPAMTR